MIVRRLIPALMAFFTAACAITPDPEVVEAADMCNFPKSFLEVDTFDGGAAFRGSGAQGFARTLVADYKAVPLKASDARDEPISESMLFISGGSQDGAFGAGFLHGWADLRPQGLPRYKVVTGISTGAIMATHALLDRTDDIRANYLIEGEGRILESYLGSSEPESLAGLLKIARKGAVGNLGPMKKLLGDAIGKDVLVRVAEEADKGRRLYVAAVDVDLGQAVVFHMSEMAILYRKALEAGDDKRQGRIRNCYLDAIVASSSVPMAAPPTFIDNRMYIDGGARFGILTDEIGTAAREINALWAAGTLKRLSGGQPRLYVLINGTIALEPQCGKQNETLCKSEPAASPLGRHAKWKLDKLAGRSVSILINQIYRFSNERIHLGNTNTGFKPETQRIRQDINTFTYSFPGAVANRDEGQTCPKWQLEDEKLERPKPLEFHRRYMHCLIAYGASKASESGWAAME